MKFLKRILEYTAKYLTLKAQFPTRMSLKSNLTTICKLRRNFQHMNALLGCLKQKLQLELAKTNALLKILIVPNLLILIKIKFNRTISKSKN